jgi:hypothetical protein
MIYKPALASGIQAAKGISQRFLNFFSAVITYFLSVYTSLTSRNAFAEGLHQLTGNSDDAVQALIRLARGGELSEARERLTSAAQMLREVHQAQRFYPVLRYFHYREPYYELPRILFTLLETVTLMRTALDPRSYPAATHSLAADEAYEAAFALMKELVEQAGSEAEGEAGENCAKWRRRYYDAVQTFSVAGLHTRTDTSAGAAEYVRQRGEWDRNLRRLAANMLYEWGTEFEH